MTSGNIAIGVGDSLAALLASSLRLTFVTFGKGRSISRDAAFTLGCSTHRLAYMRDSVYMDWDCRQDGLGSLCGDL